MKRFFNRSNPQAPTPYYNPEPDPYEHGGGSPTREYPLGTTRSRQDEQAMYDQRTGGTLERSGMGSKQQLRRGGGLTSPRLQATPSATSTSTGGSSNRRPRSGGAGAAAAYPSYGEVQLDSNENKGGGAFISPPSTELGEAVSHQRLPPRSTIPRSPVENHHHSRSRSNVSNHGQQAPIQNAQRRPSYSTRAESQQMVEPLHNPFANGDTSSPIERRTSTRQKKGGSGLNRSKSSSVRPFADGMGMQRPNRRPSLLYGIDSGVHGGFASAALANASERESRDYAHDDGQDRDTSVYRPESRYVDRYTDSKTAQGAATGTGMDKMKRKLFGRRKKDGQLHLEERETDSGEDGSRFEPLREVGTPDRTPRRSGSRERHRGEGKAEHSHAGVAWFSNKKMGHANKQTEGAITSQIGSLCIQEEDEWDWDEINSLIFLISHSEVASKEAAQALRKEFKYGEDEPRFRAVRLWVIVCIRASDRFRLQVAQKKFLDVLEDMYSDKKTSTKLRGRLLLSLSMLAHENQLDHDLQSITRLFNKIKPSDMPMNGSPLDHSHELLNPPVSSTRQYSPPEQAPPGAFRPEPNAITGWNGENRRAEEQMMASMQAQEQPPSTMTKTITTTTVVRSSSISQPVTDSVEGGAVERLPRLSDDIRRLHQECHVARSNAQVVTEALIEHGLQDELVGEFATKAQLSQDFILAQIPWASAQADRSRADHATHDGSISREEELLKDLLETHEKVAAANGLVEEARRREREEDEERQVLDRSMREQRIDRSALVQDSQTGHLYSLFTDGRQDSREHVIGGLTIPRDREQASSSRSASPVPPLARRPLPVPGSADLLRAPANAVNAMQKSLSAASQVPLPPSMGSTGPPSLDGSWIAGSNGSDEQQQQLHGSKSLSAMQRGGGPRQMTEPSPLAATTPATPNRPMNGSLRVDRRNDEGGGEEDEDGDSVIMTPIAPSAKALGKRRAMSIYDSPPAASNASTTNKDATAAPDAPTTAMGGSDLQGGLVAAPALSMSPLHQIDEQLGSMRLGNANHYQQQQKEEALRARPPPALPPTTLQQHR